MANKNKIKGVAYVKEGVNLCQFEGFTCFGCCGYDFRGKDLAKESILLQTHEYRGYENSISKKLEFRERAKPDDLNACNFCRNLILGDHSFSDGKIDQKVFENRKLKVLCPLHPACNEGTDLRDGHCTKNYMCLTQVKFHKMKKLEQEKFVAWLKKRINKDDLDWYTYSVYMDTDRFWKEYKSSK
jgi:hypothetical protein